MKIIIVAGAGFADKYMKKLILLVLSFIPLNLQAQPAGIPGPLLDLEDSKAIEDMLVNSYVERAARENYYDKLDIEEAAKAGRPIAVGRFGTKGDKPLTYYVEIFYKDKAVEQLEREMNNKSQMLDEALEKERQIRAELAERWRHYNLSVTTIKDFEQQILHWQGVSKGLDAKLKSCKKTRGRKC